MRFHTWGEMIPYSNLSEDAPVKGLPECKGAPEGSVSPHHGQGNQIFLDNLYKKSQSYTHTGLVISKLLHKYIPKNFSALQSKHSSELSEGEGDSTENQESSSQPYWEFVSHINAPGLTSVIWKNRDLAQQSQSSY